MRFAVRFAGLMALTAMCLCLAVPARAHKVNVFAYVENGRILGEGYFADGGKAKDVAVVLTDASGRELARAQTGADGAFSLPLPAAAPPLTVVLVASEGHRNQYVLTAADIGQAAPAQPVQPVQPVQAAPAQAPPGPSSSVAPAAAPPAPVAESVTLPKSPDAEAIAALVDKAVEARLAPIKAQLARLAEQGDKVGAKDVVGGLGWILGLFGVAAYFASKRTGQSGQSGGQAGG